jgi:hypothetical protein
MDPLLTPRAAAERLGITEGTLAKWRLRASGPPFCKIGARVMYRTGALDTWIAERERLSTSDDGARAVAIDGRTGNYRTRWSAKQLRSFERGSD